MGIIGDYVHVMKPLFKMVLATCTPTISSNTNTIIINQLLMKLDVLILYWGDSRGGVGGDKKSWQCWKEI